MNARACRNASKQQAIYFHNQSTQLNAVQAFFLKLDLWYREAKAKQSAGIETCTINMNKVVHNDVQWQCELFLQSMWLKRDDQRSMQSDMQSVTCKVKVESWKCHIQSEQRKLNHDMDDSFWFSTANLDPKVFDPLNVIECRKLIAECRANIHRCCHQQIFGRRLQCLPLAGR